MFVCQIFCQVSYLALTGGYVLRECVKLIMKKTLRKDIAQQFSYCGRQKKQAFQDLRINKAILSKAHFKCCSYFLRCIMLICLLIFNVYVNNTMHAYYALCHLHAYC